MGPIQPRLVRRKTEHPRTKPACLDNIILGFWGVTRGRGVRVPASAAPTLHPTNSKKVMSHAGALITGYKNTEFTAQAVAAHNVTQAARRQP